MNKAQLQRKAGKLQLFLTMLICFFMSGFHAGYSQDEYFKDDAGKIIGTSDSRVAATIVETEAGVTMQVFAVGEISFDVLEFTFFVKQSELVWSDKTFTESLPYRAHDPRKTPQTYEDSLFVYYVDLNPEMKRGGGKGMEFNFTQLITRYREAGLTKATPELTYWSDVEGMDALRVAINTTVGECNLAAGEMKHIFSCYFKKLHPGKTLEKSDIGVGVKTLGTMGLGRGGYFCPKWVFGGLIITYDDANPGSNKQLIHPELFFYRTPSSVVLKSEGEITPVTAELNGSFLRGALSLPPSSDLLDGRNAAQALRYAGKLNWDKITQNGFIYTSDAVTSLSVKEYTDSLFINGEGYLFPNAAEITAGEFTRGEYTLYIKMAANSETGSSVDYSLTLEDLDPATPYTAWPCIAYTFETSNEYFKTGESFSYSTTPDCFAPLSPVTFSQSFCGSATVKDLIAVAPAGSVLEWFDTPTVTGPSLDESTPLVDGIYYARASESVITTCYSDSVEITVTLSTGLGAPSAATPQYFCSGAKVSELQASGSNIQWYDVPNGGLPLNSGDELSDGIYYAAQSASGCQSSDRTPVQVKIDALELQAPAIVNPQSFCGTATLKDIATDGSLLKWYDAAGEPLAESAPLTVGTTYYAAQLSGSCQSVSRTAVLINGATPAVPEISAQSFCPGATLASIQVPNNQIVWYSAATGGILLPGNTVLTDGVTYYAALKAGASCESNRKAVSVSIGSMPAPVGLTNQVFCISATVADLQVTGAAVQWYNKAGDLLELTDLLSTGTYFAFQGSCDSYNRKSLAVDVNILEFGLTAPRADNPQTFCDGATVANLKAIGSNIQWYDAEGATGKLLSGTDKLSNGTIYYASQSTKLCESTSRTPVRVVIEEAPATSPLEIEALQYLCQPAYISDIAIGSIGTVIWYDAATGGNKLESDADISAGGTYYAELIVGNCPAPRVPVQIRIMTGSRPGAPEFNESLISQYFCPGAVLSNVLVPNNQIKWYLSDGTLLSGDYLLPEGTSFLYAAQSAGSCESLSSGRVEITIEVGASSLPAPEAKERQVICKANATLADLRVTGTGIIWYDAAENGNLHNIDKKLINGETYHAAQKASSGCESTGRAPVTVVINPEIEIVQAPVNTYLCPGESAHVTLSVTALTDNASALSYQWFDEDNELISTSEFALLSTEDAMGKTYSVVVGNECYSLDALTASVGENPMSVIVQKRDHTLIVNNNPTGNGGYTFEYYKWYRNGVEIQPKLAGGESRGGYYYTAAGLDMGIEYYAEMWDINGDYYRSCPFIPQPKASGAVSVYPNPLVSSQVVYVDADLDEDALAKASIEVYSPLGSYIGKVNAQRLTPVRLPEEKGVYILKFRAEELEENFKIIVK